MNRKNKIILQTCMLALVALVGTAYLLTAPAGRGNVGGSSSGGGRSMSSGGSRSMAGGARNMGSRSMASSRNIGRTGMTTGRNIGSGRTLASPNTRLAGSRVAAPAAATPGQMAGRRVDGRRADGGRFGRDGRYGRHGLGRYNRGFRWGGLWLGGEFDGIWYNRGVLCYDPRYDAYVFCNAYPYGLGTTYIAI